jgi:hypothetical protein
LKDLALLINVEKLGFNCAFIRYKIVPITSSLYLFSYLSVFILEKQMQ